MNLSPEEVINKEDLKVIEESSKCLICDYILFEPVQCLECDNCFCQSCINKWLVKNKDCPLRCKNPKYKGNRYINKVLSVLKFKCRNGCNTSIKYEDIKKHYKEDCKKLDFKKNYKELLKKYNDLKLIMKNKVLPIDHSHQFIATYPGDSHICDLCEKKFDIHQHSFTCSTCNIDFCDDCSFKLLNPNTTHPHNLELVLAFNQTCDLCKLSCHQAIKMTCKKCNYKECLICYTNHDLNI